MSSFELLKAQRCPQRPISAKRQDALSLELRANCQNAIAASYVPVTPT